MNWWCIPVLHNQSSLATTQRSWSLAQWYPRPHLFTILQQLLKVEGASKSITECSPEPKFNLCALEIKISRWGLVEFFLLFFFCSSQNGFCYFSMYTARMIRPMSWHTSHAINCFCLLLLAIHTYFPLTHLFKKHCKWKTGHHANRRKTQKIYEDSQFIACLSYNKTQNMLKTSQNSLLVPPLHLTSVLLPSLQRCNTENKVYIIQLHWGTLVQKLGAKCSSACFTVSLHHILV